MADYFTLFDLGLLLLCLLCVAIGATTPLKGLIFMGGFGMVLVPFAMALPFFVTIILVFVGLVVIFGGIKAVSS